MDLTLLESREAALHTKLLGASASPSASSPLSERLRRLQTQLDQLSGAVSGSMKLRELYQEHASHLTIGSANVLTLSSSRAGDELKRATILSSIERLQEATAQLQHLRELTSVLDQLQGPNSSQLQQLQQLETHSEIQTERTLALHSRVERMLATYQQMMLVLSEKCAEHNALLDQLQV
ncbi:hypothetical protein BBO99_00008033 [Phytophthora kernoviae]|uniref:Uncharacterized protein n=2 Tax=Phytophthora kernoviae TaxID=325452 RepID=A0A421FE64_9STRA|nr:hypothetical protein G195_009097 [Phytophthora kernoviae 00238/432]KAG2515876.1 hypothetical protein JM16_007685 [Phytophthora kernoviae]KAG2519324.1 hypothetical protein JM18_007591 [Phytophthora kernoviae]RLN38321.1 hypothetical protein BBI17_007954 [Phytophthora kernoviae]RLN75827.1 hypothetical protein BBO99_00008033 [Phytophthora kernoviae]